MSPGPVAEQPWGMLPQSRTRSPSPVLEMLALPHTHARKEHRTLNTDARDLAQLVFKHPEPDAGVIYLGLETTKIALRTARLDDVLTIHRDQLDQFLVVTEQTIRVGEMF